MIFEIHSPWNDDNWDKIWFFSTGYLLPTSACTPWLRPLSRAFGARHAMVWQSIKNQKKIDFPKMKKLRKNRSSKTKNKKIQKICNTFFRTLKVMANRSLYTKKKIFVFNDFIFINSLVSFWILDNFKI